MLRHARDADEAADLTQNAFVKAYVGLPHLRDVTKFDSWLFRIALNECRMARRADGVGTVSLDEVSEASPEVVEQLALPSTEATVMRAEAVRAIRKAIDELSEQTARSLTHFSWKSSPTHKSRSSTTSVAVRWRRAFTGFAKPSSVVSATVWHGSSASSE